MTDQKVSYLMVRCDRCDAEVMNGLTCPYCGDYHKGVCPKVSRIDYFPDGTVKSVEFRGPSLGLSPTEQRIFDGIPPWPDHGKTAGCPR